MEGRQPDLLQTLIPFLLELIESLERHGRISLPGDVRESLLASEWESRRGVSATRPGSLLKKQIQVRTFADWDDLRPGFLDSSSTVGLSKFPVDSHLRRRESVLALGFQSIGKVIPTPDPPS